MQNEGVKVSLSKTILRRGGGVVAANTLKSVADIHSVAEICNLGKTGMAKAR